MPFIDTDRKEYDYLVFIGRFQIPHYGHFSVIKTALEKSERVILGIGSANLSRSLKNPFTVDERIQMITNCGVPKIEQAYKDGRIIFMPLDDYPYQDGEWVRQVKVAVAKIARTKRAGLIGCAKDHTSYYLKLFPQWPSVGVPLQEDYNSTRCRSGFYEASEVSDDFLYLTNATTDSVCLHLTRFVRENREQYKAFCAEHKFIKEYKKSWEAAPFPPTFNTVDSVVFWEDNGVLKVLAIKRGDHPGKGLYATPGGFINIHEELYDACLRELTEETGLKITYPGFDYGISVDLNSCLKGEKTFGSPGRDPRGRTITTAFCFRLPDACTPVIEAGDDAAEVLWRPWDDCKSNEFIADHYWMIRYFKEHYID